MKEFDLKLLTAEAFIRGRWEKDIPTLNPGAWFGKARVLSVEGGYVPLRLVVEADGFGEAIDVLADHEIYKREVLIPEDEYKDYGTHVYAGTLLPGGEAAPVEGWVDLNGAFLPSSSSRTLQEADFAGNAGLPCRTSHVDELHLPRTPGIRHNILYTHPDWEVLKSMSPQAFYDFQNICSFEDTLWWFYRWAPHDHDGEIEVNEAMGTVDIVRGADKGDGFVVEDTYPEIHRQFLRHQAEKS